MPPTYGHYPIADRIRTTKTAYRGTPSPLTKILGNLHGHISPLRRQFYNDIGLEEGTQIHEVYPEWDNKLKKVIWIDRMVTAFNDEENNLRGLLMNPFDAIQHFFGEQLFGSKPVNVSNLHWENHKFSMCFVVLELHCSLLGIPIIKMLIDAR